MKILLVDDSGTMRAIQKRCLFKLGVAEDQVVEADNGQTGLAEFEKGNFDIVLTDWNMPVMDGLTMLKEIRSRNKDIPIIMITTESERARVVAAIEAGVSDYLVKPYTADALNAKLEKWVPASV
ncbi:response regulator [bacterium]|nr:response regulator [bacterium]